MNLLTLDLATTTGWAAATETGIKFGHQSFKPQRFEGGGMRFLRFEKWLYELRSLVDFHIVLFEEVRGHKGTDAAHIYGGLMATLTSWCEKNGYPYQGVPVGTIKAHATGKGNSGKDLMIKAMRAKGHEVQDDNEADALALLYWGMENVATGTTDGGFTPHRRVRRKLPMELL